MSQTDIERLKSYLRRCPAEGERVSIQFLFEAWTVLPKLLAFVDAYDYWLKLYTQDCREDLEDDGSLELAVLNLDSAREALDSTSDAKDG